MLQLSFVNFKPSSYILVEGTEATDYFFIIQSGHVKCYNEIPIAGIPPLTLGPGDFIGVIPCMTGQRQIQNVVSTTPVVAIMVKRAQYPELIMKNTPVAMKIVRSFARDMRHINDQLTKLTLNKTNVSTPEQIFAAAEYFENMGMYMAAAYGYFQYIRECPSGMNVATAQQRFGRLKTRAMPPYIEASTDSIRTYPRGAMIFYECQHGSDMYIIQSGSVRISKVVAGKEVTLALLKKGDLFGEMALLENLPRSANAIANEEARLMVVNKENFNQMVTTQPQMISKLTTMFADRLWTMQRQLTNTQLRDTREKLIDMISLQLEKQKIPFSKETYHTGFTVQAIMNLCVIPQRDQYQAMQLLQTDQCVHIVSGRIDVPDVAQLIRQAAFYRKQNSKHVTD